MASGRARAVIVLVQLLCLSGAYGLEVRPHTASVAISGLAEVLQKRSVKELANKQAFEKVSSVSIRGRAHALGRFDVSLTTKRNLLSAASIQRADSLAGKQELPLLLQGSVALGGGVKRLGSTRVVPAAASVIGNQLSLSFNTIKRTGTSREHQYLIRVPVIGTTTLRARIKRLPRFAAERGSCDSVVEDVEGHRAEHRHTAGKARAASQFTARAVTRIVTLSTDADPEWYSRYGAQSLAQIASIVNTAEALYFHSIAIGFSIHKQHIYTENSPYTSTDPGTLLNQFVTNPNNRENLSSSPELYESEVDAKHLFTGKDLDGSTVGIAYIRSICKYPALAFGLSQNVFDVAAPAVFAHEIAHNFGAFHDLSNSGSLMYPSLVMGASVRFSELSIHQIEGHLAQDSSCLHEENREIPPTPTPGDPVQEPIPNDPVEKNPAEDPELGLSLEVKARLLQTDRRLLVVRGRLTDGKEAGVADRTVKLYRNGRPSAYKSTNAKGRVSFVLPRRLTREVYLATQRGQTVSKTLGVAREIR